MPVETFASNRLRIHRLRVECLVPRDHPAPDRVSRHVADIAERHLSRTLRSMLEGGVADSDPSLCFINRLEMGCDVNIGWNSDQLTHCLAARTVRQLYAELGDEGAGANVVRFRNPAEYLAAFLNDLVQGQAWTQWYYQAFDGVRLLPLSAAIRTVLENHAGEALSALHTLDRQSLRQLLTSLTKGDCERVVESLTREASAGDQTAAYDAVAEALKDLPYAELKRLSPECATLWLYIETTRRTPTVASRSVGEAAFVICRCVQSIHEASSRDRERLLFTITTNNLSNLDASVIAKAAEWLVPLLNRPEAWRREFVDLLEHEGRSSTDGQSESGESIRSTPFGGIFYLLPLFAELPLEPDLPKECESDGVASEAVLRLLILAKAYGTHDAVAVARDPVVQELCGLPPGAVSRSLFVEWQRRLTVPDLERMARQVVQQGFHIEKQAKPAWVLTTTATQDGPVTLLLDAERGAWLWAIRARSNHADVITRKVKHTLEQWPAGVRLIACDAPYYQTMKSMEKVDHVLDLAVSGEEQTEEELLLQKVAHHRGSLPEELDALSLPSSFGISRARDRALSVLTQAYLRRFAYRLPGFAWSSGRHLAQNLFACSATMELESQRRVVRVSHPPLHLLLSVTGLNRRSYTLPWVDNRPLLLFPDDGSGA